MSNPINDMLYKERQDFSIVALTGVLGSGFEDLTKLMKDKKLLMQNVRYPRFLATPSLELMEMKEIDDFNKDENYKAIWQLMFNRKYTICYNYASEHYAPYKVLKYNYVLWLYTLKYIVEISLNECLQQDSGELLKEQVSDLLKKHYRAYKFEKDDQNPDHNRLNKTFNQYNDTIKIDTTTQIVDKLNVNWEELYKCIKVIPDFINNPDKTDSAEISAVYFDCENEFNVFCEAIKKRMLETDYYLYCMFYWRLGICIRAVNNPMMKMGDEENEEDKITGQNDGLFSIVHLIVAIIKGYHKTNKQSEQKGCRICIDSLRNSFEAKYLQERFSAFYLVNVYNPNVISTINANIEKLCKKNDNEKEEDYRRRLDLIKETTYQLYKKEATSEVSKKHLAMHDVDTCVANAEIHITHRALDKDQQKLIYANDITKLSESQVEERKQLLAPVHFYYLAEQWMKFATLIQRPGLFSPETDERCMQIAYTAKFNSGCISRQVGAAITNKYGSIRTIGWNDPPFGQVPCGMRDVRDIARKLTKEQRGELCSMYSDFELGGFSDENEKSACMYKGGLNFHDKITEAYEKIKWDNIDEMRGLPIPYCFKSCHTTWFPKEAGNSFHQRAIHAEENAMMQMVKFGGEALKSGVIYVTASPCEICSKKLYQIGIRKIVYIDPYPGIARQQVIESGFRRPELVNYEGAYGATYFKLYSHFIDYKDELQIGGLNLPLKDAKQQASEKNAKLVSKKTC